MSSLFHKYKTTFFISILAYVFVYGFEISNFTLSIDEEYLNNNYHALSLGRWGHELLKLYIFHEPFIPFFSLIFAISIFSISNVLACNYLNLEKIDSIIFTILMVGMPQLAYQIEFTQQIDTVSLAVLASTCAVYFIEKISLKNSIIFILLTIVSLSIYQGVFVITITLLMCKHLHNYIVNECNFNYKKLIINISYTFIFLVISFIFNKILTKIFLMLFNVSDIGYISDIVRWGKDGSYLRNIASIFGSPIWNFIIKPFYGFKLFFIIIIASIFVLLKGKNRITSAILIFLTFYSAFCLNVVAGSGLPARSYFSIPLMFGFIVFLALKTSTLNKYVKIFTVAVIITFGAAQANILFYSDYMARKSDDAVAQRILFSIYQKYPDFDIVNSKIFFYGKYEPINVWKPEKSDTFGYSYFSEGINSRLINYFKISNFAHFENASYQEKKSTMNVIPKIPSWPNPNSIYKENNVLIVKLSNEPQKYNFINGDRR